MTLTALNKNILLVFRHFLTVNIKLNQEDFYLDQEDFM